MAIIVLVNQCHCQAGYANALPQVSDLQMTDHQLEEVYRSQAVLLTPRALTDRFLDVVVEDLVSREPFVSLQPSPENS